MKVTIKDVAKEANVATSTVSRVLSNSSRISEETKKKVNEAIKKLNYTPNVVARGLANNRTRILAVVLPDGAEKMFSNPFFAQALKGISICAQKEKYYIMYGFKDENSGNDWIKQFTESNLVDGLCLFNAKDNDEEMEYLKSIKFPFVIIGRPEDAKGILWADNDNFQTMYKLTEEIIEMGHENIAFVGAKENLNVSKDRLEGYKHALTSRGIEYNENIVIIEDDFTEECGYSAMEKIIVNKEVSAVLTTDDLMAFGVQDKMMECNISNIAVVGFNNTPLAEYRKIPLSSVDINAEKLGYYGAKLLIDKLERRESNKKSYIIDTKFVVRKSLFRK